MLIIDDKKVKLTKKNIFVGKFTLNGEEGYNICIQLRFINIDTNKQGYINLDAGFEKNNDLNSFLNREYKGIPFDNDDKQYISFEVFDTKKFLDTEIDSNITIKLKDMKKDKVKISFELNDEFIKIKYDGLLDIDCNSNRDSIQVNNINPLF